MRKVDKARMLGHNLSQEQISLLYYLWAKNDSTSYCSLVNSETCYKNTDYLPGAMNLYADGFLEIDDNDASSYRLSKTGRILIMQLGM